MCRERIAILQRSIWRNYIENLNSKKKHMSGITKGIIIHLSIVIQSAALYSVCVGNIRRGNMYALSRELCSPAAVAE